MYAFPHIYFPVIQNLSVYISVAVCTVHNNLGTSSLVLGLIGLCEDSLITLRVPTSEKFFDFLIDGSGGSVISPFLLFVNRLLQTRDFRDTLRYEIDNIGCESSRVLFGFVGTDGRDQHMIALMPQHNSLIGLCVWIGMLVYQPAGAVGVIRSCGPECRSHVLGVL